MILKTKYLTVGSTIITAIDIHVWTIAYKTKVIPAKQFSVWEMSSLALHIRKTVQNSQTATFLLFNFVKGLAQLTVITLFALLFVI